MDLTATSAFSGLAPDRRSPAGCVREYAAWSECLLREAFLADVVARTRHQIADEFGFADVAGVRYLVFVLRAVFFYPRYILISVHPQILRKRRVGEYRVDISAWQGPIERLELAVLRAKMIADRIVAIAAQQMGRRVRVLTRPHHFEVHDLVLGLLLHIGL